MAVIGNTGSRPTLHGTAGIPKEAETPVRYLIPCEVSPFFVNGSRSPGQHMLEMVRYWRDRFANSDTVSREEFECLRDQVAAMADVLSSLLSDPNILRYMMDAGKDVDVVFRGGPQKPEHT